MRRSRIVSGLSVLLALSAAGCAPHPAETFGAAVEAITAVCATDRTLEGLDVSYAQGAIDWAQVRASGRVFAYARATGGTMVDSRFADNWPAMRAASVVRGAYHFFHPTEDADAQAELFLRTVGRIEPTDLPPMLDVETYTRTAADGTTETIPADEIAAAARRWIDHVQAATGRIPVVYTATFIWSSHVHSAAFADNPLWIADWLEDCPRVPAPWTTWAIQQYAPGPDADHSIPGIDRAIVDHDRFNGGRAALDRFILSTIVSPATSADGGVADAAARDGGAGEDAGADADPALPLADAGRGNGDGDGAREAAADGGNATSRDRSTATPVAGCSVRGPSSRSTRDRAVTVVVLALGALATRLCRRRRDLPLR